MDDQLWIRQTADHSGPILSSNTEIQDEESLWDKKRETKYRRSLTGFGVQSLADHRRRSRRSIQKPD